MSPEQRAEINRENAMKSTGPKTPAGKAAAKRNSLKHGIYARDLILEYRLVREDPKELQRLLDGLREDLQPEGTTQTVLVEKIGVSLWRLGRLYRAERAKLQLEVDLVRSDPGYPNLPEADFFGCDEPLDFEDNPAKCARSLELERMPPEELHQQEEFREFVSESYPDCEMEELSEHQL